MAKKVSIEYSEYQIITEIQKVSGGKWINDTFTFADNEEKSAKRRLKGRGVDPEGHTFEDMLLGTRSPWGIVDYVISYPDEGKGIFGVGTPTHGGLWIGDQWIKKLPKDYKPFTGNRRWAEEDQDANIVLQHFGLLSLLDEPLEIELTHVDIDNGRNTRKTSRGNPWFNNPNNQYETAYYGGPISEAYKRITRYDDDLICTKTYMQMKPSGWKECKLPKEAQIFMSLFDKGEFVHPITFVLEPYVYPNVKTEQLELKGLFNNESNQRSDNVESANP